jgi:hypothetical protein
MLYSATGTLSFSSLSLLLVDSEICVDEKFIYQIVPAVAFVLTGLFFKL